MICVVKIGGSLDADPSLSRWLALLSRAGRGRVVVVPGGGAFAARVRDAQARWRFDDRVAHNMAVLAMVQYAMLMHGVCSALVPATSPSAVRGAIEGGGVALWMPYELLREHEDALTTWNVTSDSLAAWLADRLDASRLVLVKSCRIPYGASLAQCADAGIVDLELPKLVRGARYSVELLHKGDLARMQRSLECGDPTACQASSPPAP